MTFSALNYLSLTKLTSENYMKHMFHFKIIKNQNKIALTWLCYFNHHKNEDFKNISKSYIFW